MEELHAVVDVSEQHPNMRLTRPTSPYGDAEVFEFVKPAKSRW